MNAIELKGLKKSFPDFTLGPVDLAVPEGTILGLIGENGAGKSTTIKLMLGLLRTDAGSITILGQDAKKLDKNEIGVVLDEPGFPTLLNAKEIRSFLKDIYRHWDDAAWQDYMRRFELPQEKKFSDFSKGMKMKLAIAAAMSHHARLLILDEPTSGLDPVVRDEVVTILSEFTREPEHSILLSSHIVSDLEKLCDYIAFLHKGQLLLNEEKDALYEEYGLLRCDLETLRSLDPAAVIGKKETPYGAEVILRREAAGNLTLSPIGIEELFVFMVKGGDGR
ncbi:MAG: ABC transporter ATP-binding protein [Oscillospiraceae bacterium]|nr:ABC transporter ATP-binding protein [Oscillospiraceae bacterium]MBQ6403264.1 ABC transporter ATP-binding protein [Oscillospiraceae bacterium]